MPLHFREDKATQAAGLLLKLGGGGPMNIVKLTKLMYLLDRQALLRWGRLVTFDSYFSLPNGPIGSTTLDLIKCNRRPGASRYWSRHISERVDHAVRLLELPPLDELSRAEEALIREIHEEFGNLNEWDLVKITHDLPEWNDPGSGRVAIQLSDILSSGGFSESEIEEIEAEQEYASRVHRELC